MAYSGPSGREPPHRHVCFLLLLSVSGLPGPSGQSSQLQRQPSLVKCLSGRRLARVFLPLVAWEKVRSALVRSLALEQPTPGLRSCCRASLSIAHAHLWFFVFLFKFSIFLAVESSLTLGNPVLQLSSTNVYSSLVPSLAVILLWNFWLCSSRKSSVEPQLVSYNTVNSFFSKDE